MTLALALLLDALLGEPAWLWSRLPHPATLMGRAVEALERRLNEGGARRAKGAAAVGLLAGGSALIGLLLAALPGQIAEVIVAAVLLAQRSLCDHVAAVASALERSPAEGRERVGLIVGRDTSEMTPPEIARAAIESAAENFSDGVVAPAFWFLLAGLPGILVYKVVNTADSMVGYRTPRHEAFGWAAARLDDVMNWVPARLTAGLIRLTAPGTTMEGLGGDARLHRSPNAGWPEAAMARALGVALSGPRSYHGHRSAFPFVNETGEREIGPLHIRLAIRRLWVSWALLLALSAALGLVIG